MLMHTNPRLLTLLLLTLPGCTSPESSPAVPTLSLTLLHVLGDSSTFTDPWSAALGPTGVVAVADRGDLWIRTFDALGHQTGELGGRGQAPGEFLSLGGPEWRGGGFWAADLIQNRLTYFDANARLLRTEAYRAPPPPLSPDGGHWGVPIGFLGDSLEVLAISRPTRLLDRPTHPRLLLAQGGLPVDSIPLPEEPPLALNIVLPGDMRLSILQPFRRTGWDLAPEGAGLLIAREPVPGRVQLTLLRTPSDTAVVLELALPPIPLREASVDRWLTRDFPKPLPGPVSGLADSLRARVARPKYLPSVTGLYFAPDHSLWLRGVDSLAGAVTWHHWTADRRYRGTLSLAAADKILWARGDSLLIRRDTDAGPQVGLFRRTSGVGAR